jgi:hypothetical protein
MKTLLFILILMTTSHITLAQNKQPECQIHYAGPFAYTGYEDDNHQRLVCDNGASSGLNSELQLEFVDFRVGNDAIAKNNSYLNKTNASDFIENKNISKLLNKYRFPFFSQNDKKDFLEIGLNPVEANWLWKVWFSDIDKTLNSQSKLEFGNSYKYCKNKEHEGKVVFAFLADFKVKTPTLTMCISSDVSNIESRQQLNSIVDNLGKPDVAGRPYIGGNHFMSSPTIDVNFPMAHYTIKHNGKYLIVRITRSPYTIQVTDLTNLVTSISDNIKAEAEF